MKELLLALAPTIADRLARAFAADETDAEVIARALTATELRRLRRKWAVERAQGKRR